jgi:hypothetical protein
MAGSSASAKRKILIQLDGDPRPSVFDRVVAVDAGVDFVFSYGGVTPDVVRDLVYGAIFTRGGDDLRRSAVFVGGSDVALGEEILAAARKSFLGPLRVSLMLDSAGCNTTAAAAVVVASRALDLHGVEALVLGSTGSVGERVARLLARRGAAVRLGSRSLERAQEVAEVVRAAVQEARVSAAATGSPAGLEAALDGVRVVVAAGGAGVSLLPLEARRRARSLELAIDLNAVPPEGIAGIKGTDAGAERDGVKAWGAIGVGGLKMKIHKAAVARLFEANDQILDAEEMFEIGVALGKD